MATPSKRTRQGANTPLSSRKQNSAQVEKPIRQFADIAARLQQTCLESRVGAVSIDQQLHPRPLQSSGPSMSSTDFLELQRLFSLAHESSSDVLRSASHAAWLQRARDVYQAAASVSHRRGKLAGTEEDLLEEINDKQEKVYQLSLDVERYSLLQRRVEQSLYLNSHLNAPTLSLMRLRDDRSLEAMRLNTQMNELREQLAAMHSQQMRLTSENARIAAEIRSINDRQQQYGTGAMTDADREAIRVLKERNNMLLHVLRGLAMASGVDWYSDPGLRDTLMP